MIFGEENNETILIEQFSEIISRYADGDVIEFGTGSGGTAIEIAKKNSHRKIFTIDHFQGLEKTKKRIWEYSGWSEGAFKLGVYEPWKTKTIDSVLKEFSDYNIILIEEDIHKLKSPEEYGINNTIIACHIDVDIYEPTVSALNFLDECIWNSVFIRFDDWHGHDDRFDEHERLAFKEWIEETGYRYDIINGGHAGGVMVERH